jgi:hypothetical protein
MQLEQQPTQTFKRNPFEIIGECFSIYGRHIRQFLLIALIVHIVIGAVESVTLPSDEELQALLQFGTTGEQSANTPQLPPFAEVADLLFPISVYLLITTVFQTFLSGAIACAVGMQYVTGAVDAGVSYSRTFWRVLTLLMIGLLSFALIVLVVVGFALLIVPGILILTLMIYWSVATQAVVLEGYKPLTALSRSFNLVRGNWWRTFAAWALIILVTIGLSLLIGLPLSALTEVIGLKGLAGKTIETLVKIIAGAIIAPIPGIAVALIYLDLRARSEDYDIEALSQDMGFSPRSDEYGLDAQ